MERNEGEMSTRLNGRAIFEVLKAKKGLIPQTLHGVKSDVLCLRINLLQHVSQVPCTSLKQLKFEVDSHSPYSPDLASCDFHFFPDFESSYITSDEEKKLVKSWSKDELDT